MDSAAIQDFQDAVWQKGRELFRAMPWREDTRPYYVLVSEIMLQQTQVDRVIPKFEAFIAAFPAVEVLANAPLSQVLELWSGLGYNRRAKFLHEAAKMIVREYGGVFPKSAAELMKLSGVGVNTAGAIQAYSFNTPALFIETNVRTVYFHHFFPDALEVHDTEIKTLLETTVDIEHPREWYWALMDYGTYLKRQGMGANAKSKHYKKQAPLEGSVRQVRGRIVKTLTETRPVTLPHLKRLVGVDDRFEPAYQGLLKDGLVLESDNTVQLAP